MRLCEQHLLEEIREKRNIDKYTGSCFGVNNPSTLTVSGMSESALRFRAKSTWSFRAKITWCGFFISNMRLIQNYWKQQLQSLPRVYNRLAPYCAAIKLSHIDLCHAMPCLPNVAHCNAFHMQKTSQPLCFKDGPWWFWTVCKNAEELVPEDLCARASRLV